MDSIISGPVKHSSRSSKRTSKRKIKIRPSRCLFDRGHRMSVLNKNDLVFVAAKRTPFGTFGGSLTQVSATDLAVESSKACLTQSGIKATDLDAVVFGNVIQSSSDAIYLARHV